MPAGPEQLTLQALSSEQRGHRVFIDRLSWATLAANRLVSTKRFHAREQQSRQGGACLTRTGMINQVCRGWMTAKSRTRVSERSESPLSETL